MVARGSHLPPSLERCLHPLFARNHNWVDGAPQLKIGQARPGMMHDGWLKAAMFFNLKQQGVSLAQGTFPLALVARCLEIADMQYACIGLIEPREGVEGVQRWLPHGAQYLPNVSSISLQGVYSEAEWQKILNALAETSLLAMIEQELGGPCVCDLDRAWVRRQYAIHRRPPGHATHSWHQDGALLYPFEPAGAQAPAADGLLHMVTCWLALTPMRPLCTRLGVCARTPGLVALSISADRRSLAHPISRRTILGARIGARGCGDLFGRHLAPDTGGTTDASGSNQHRVAFLSGGCDSSPAVGGSICRPFARQRHRRSS